MEAKKEKYKRIRGAILKLLAHSHPGTIDSKVLYFLLDDLHYTISEDEFKSHCSYLAEKNLIKIEIRKSGGVEIQMIIISSHGLDLLDGFIDEPGVDVRF